MYFSYKNIIFFLKKVYRILKKMCYYYFLFDKLFTAGKSSIFKHETGKHKNRYKITESVREITYYSGVSEQAEIIINGFSICSSF